MYKPYPVIQELETIIENWDEHKTMPARDDMIDTLRRTADLLYDLKLYDIRKIGDYINDGVFICDRGGVIRYVNNSNQRMIGVDSSQCIGHTATEMFEKFGINNAITNELLNTGEPHTSITFSESGGVQLLEIGSPIVGGDGEVEGCIIIDKDITKTIRMAETLATINRKRLPLSEAQKVSHRVVQVLENGDEEDEHLEWRSGAMRLLEEQIAYAAHSDVTVLLTGKTGTGKEVAANKICKNSARRDRPFVKVNCAAIPEALVESELFGYSKGAFTGADPRGRAGAFEQANGGTLLLDEIGDLPLSFQAKLLRAIQEQTITRVGGGAEIKLDLRIIAATNRNLAVMVKDGLFREDLFYRLNVLPIHVPSLYERNEDIRTLADHFLHQYNTKYKKNVMFDRTLYQGLTTYHWPGNIRELENTVERWCVLYEPFETITWEMVGGEFTGEEVENKAYRFEGKTFAEITDAVERDVINWGLARFGSTRALAGELCVHQSTIVKKMQRLGMQTKAIKAVQ